MMNIHLTSPQHSQLMMDNTHYNTCTVYNNLPTELYTPHIQLMYTPLIHIMYTLHVHTSYIHIHVHVQYYVKCTCTGLMYIMQIS